MANAFRRHPFNAEKRREFYRTRLTFESTRAIESVRNAFIDSQIEPDIDVMSSVTSTWRATETTDSAILFAEKGEWIGHKQVKFLNEGRLPEEPCVKALDRYVVSVRNITVIGGTRYLLTEDGRVLHDEEARYSSIDVSLKYPRAERIGNNAIKVTIRPKSRQIISAGIHIMGEGDTNYFHFIVEILPRFLMAASLRDCMNCPLLITAGLHENMLAALAIVNDTGRDVIELEPDVPYHVKNLIYPSDTASILNIYGRLAKKEEGTLSVDWLRRVRAPILASVQSSIPSRRRRRLYVRRGKKIRALLNEFEIEEMLVKLGFEILALEELSFRVQVILFAEAEMIVMPTGAAVTNVLWCEPGVNVLILTSDHPAIQHSIWQLLCEVSESELVIVRGPRVNKLLGEYGVHDDFEIDADLLRSAVQNPEILRPSVGAETAAAGVANL